MLRRLIVVIGLAGGMSIAAAVTLAAPALAKGPSQARITGPGLSHAIVVAGDGEPGTPGKLADLAEHTGLFTVLFGAGGSVQAPVRPRTPPARSARGPGYTVVYTVPGVTPARGQQFGRIRQRLYPSAKGGPLVFTPPGQHGFGQPLHVTGWMRGAAGLAGTLTRLGVPVRAAAQTAGKPRQASPPATGQAAAQAGTAASGWPWLAVVIAAVVIAAAALAGTGEWLRRRRLASRV